MKVVWKSKKNNHKNKKYQKELQLEITKVHIEFLK